MSGITKIVFILLLAFGLFLVGCTNVQNQLLPQKQIPPPSSCDLAAGTSNSKAVCGEDGKTYPDSCWAGYEGKTKVAHDGPCGVDESEKCVDGSLPSEFSNPEIPLVCDQWSLK